MEYEKLQRKFICLSILSGIIVILNVLFFEKSYFKIATFSCATVLCIINAIYCTRRIRKQNQYTEDSVSPEKSEI